LAQSSSGVSPAKRKLSFKDQKEREALPGKIEELEAKQAEAVDAMGRPEFYKQSAVEIAAANAAHAALDAELAAAYARWEALEEM
jgi:ATP-binding cassette subfamily F protein uup